MDAEPEFPPEASPRRVVIKDVIPEGYAADRASPDLVPALLGAVLGVPTWLTEGEGARVSAQVRVCAANALIRCAAKCGTVGEAARGALADALIPGVSAALLDRGDGGSFRDVHASVRAAATQALFVSAHSLSAAQCGTYAVDLLDVALACLEVSPSASAASAPGAAVDEHEPALRLVASLLVHAMDEKHGFLGGMWWRSQAWPPLLRRAHAHLNAMARDDRRPRIRDLADKLLGPCASLLAVGTTGYDGGEAVARSRGGRAVPAVDEQPSLSAVMRLLGRTPDR